MLSLSPSVRIFLAVAPVDMRKGHDGLSAVVKEQVGRDPLSGAVFVLFGRRRDRVKLLVWDGSGLWVHYKRLERGRFQVPDVDERAKSVTLDETQLSMLLSGVDLNASRLPRWKPPETAIDKAPPM
jgi:transposase